MSDLAKRVNDLRIQLFEYYEDSPFEPAGSKLLGEVVVELERQDVVIAELRATIAKMQEPITFSSSGAYGNPPESDTDDDDYPLAFPLMQPV